MESAETAVDVKFGLLYGAFDVALQCGLLTAAAVAGVGVTQAGLLLSWPPFVAALAAAAVLNVAAAKRISGHAKALSLPVLANPVRGDPSKGPFLRRTVLRVKKLIFTLKPYKKLAQGALLLLALWALFAYVTVCFGAPVFSAHEETSAFAALLTILAALPAVLVSGPDRAELERVFLSDDAGPLGQLLFRKALGAVVGAWLGAFPIPLDWDRAWQAWPITCCVGAVAGHFVASLWALANIYLAKSR